MINIAILGCGTVASGVCRLLAMNKEEISRRIGEEIAITKILARTPQKARDLGFSEECICSDIEQIASDPSISVVAELMGGTGDAYAYIRRLMEAGKHVVTANKDLLALRWNELSDISRANHVDFYYEASVCGGIPLITPLKQTLAANKVTSIMAILNGTTNYILTKMSQENMSYSDALKTAQELGYVEADPTADVGGADAARKITILACLAFHSRVTLSDVYCEGITEIVPDDIETARQLGYAVKLIAYAEETDGKLLLFVRPAFVKNTHPMAAVNDVFNAVYLTCDAADEVMLYGRGAGSLPTASSVMGDIIEECRNIRARASNRFGVTCYDEKPVNDIGAFRSKFFLKLMVRDRPRVFAKIAEIMGEAGVSLAFIVQKPMASDTAEIVIITHPVYERAVMDALSQLRVQDFTLDAKTMICLEGN